MSSSSMPFAASKVIQTTVLSLYYSEVPLRMSTSSLTLLHAKIRNIQWICLLALLCGP